MRTPSIFVACLLVMLAITLWPESSDPVPSLLFEEAVERVNAAKAVEVVSYAEALTLYESARERIDLLLENYPASEQAVSLTGRNATLANLTLDEFYEISEVLTPLAQAEYDPLASARFVAETIPWPDLRARTLAEIAGRFAATDQNRQAGETIAEALQTANTLGNPDRRARSLEAVSERYTAVATRIPATPVNVQALESATEIAPPRDRAAELSRVARGYLDAGYADTSTQILLLAEEAAAQIASNRERSEALLTQAEIYLLLGNHPEAERLLEEARVISESLSGRAKTRILARLAKVYDQLGHDGKSALQLTAAIRHSRHLGEPHTQALALADIRDSYPAAHRVLRKTDKALLHGIIRAARPLMLTLRNYGAHRIASSDPEIFAPDPGHTAPVQPVSGYEAEGFFYPHPQRWKIMGVRPVSGKGGTAAIETPPYLLRGMEMNFADRYFTFQDVNSGFDYVIGGCFESGGNRLTVSTTGDFSRPLGANLTFWGDRDGNLVIPWGDDYELLFSRTPTGNDDAFKKYKFEYVFNRIHDRIDQNQLKCPLRKLDLPALSHGDLWLSATEFGEPVKLPDHNLDPATAMHQAYASEAIQVPIGNQAVEVDGCKGHEYEYRYVTDWYSRGDFYILAKLRGKTLSGNRSCERLTAIRKVDYGKVLAMYGIQNAEEGDVVFDRWVDDNAFTVRHLDNTFVFAGIDTDHITIQRKSLH